MAYQYRIRWLPTHRLDQASGMLVLGQPLMMLESVPQLLSLPKDRAVDLLRTDPHDTAAVIRLLTSFRWCFQGTIDQHTALWLACFRR